MADRQRGRHQRPREGVGWRIDALGGLAWLRCQQTDPGLWVFGPVAVWDRYMAIARAARISAWPGDGTAGCATLGSGRELSRPACAAPVRHSRMARSGVEGELAGPGRRRGRTGPELVRAVDGAFACSGRVCLAGRGGGHPRG